jgi:hypothetical protein
VLIFALIMKLNDYPEVVVIAAIGLLARQIFINKKHLWQKLTDFSTGIIPIILSGIVYIVINQKATTFSLQNSIAIVFTLIVYFGLDYFLAYSISDMLGEDDLRNFKSVKQKVYPLLFHNHTTGSFNDSYLQHVVVVISAFITSLHRTQEKPAVRGQGDCNY